MRSLAEHLESPALGEGFSHAGSASVADGCAGGSCGVLAHFRLDVDAHGTIVDCSARVRGRASAFATASALCEAARGGTVLDAARLGLGSLHPSFASMDDEDRERALVAEDGFHHAIGRWLLARMHDAPPGVGDDRPALPPALAEAVRPAVVVGMSGGVDSAVALHRAIDQHGGSHRVVGATLRLWIDPRAPDPEAACCSPDSVRRARATCHAAGAAHVSIDLREAFAREVVVPFVADYASGRTPNPCVRCNGSFRLDELVRLADVLGSPAVATGHYARIVERDGVHLVARGSDPAKDQSYMLGSVRPATTARLRFPLAREHKSAVREQAASLGLAQATVPESQEVCFLGGGDYRAFLARAKASGPAGEIVLADADGTERVVAAHDGIARFTPGQRKGIGVASHAPLYVLDVDPGSGRVLVGHDDASLRRTRVPVDRLEWYVPDPPVRVHVQLRYRARDGATPARVLHDDAGRAEIELDLATRAPAPGQAAILYDDEGAVVGSARIAREAATPAVARARPDR
jgi:tRNA-specific 2-thiouridylase